MSNLTIALAALLSRVEWLEGVPAGEREALAVRAVRRVLRAKQAFARRGEKLDVVAVVLGGTLEVQRVAWYGSAVGASSFSGPDGSVSRPRCHSVAG